MASFGEDEIDMEQAVSLASGKSHRLVEVLKRRRLVGKGPAAAERARAVTHDVGRLEATQAWRCAEPQGKFYLGQRVTPIRGTDVFLGPTDAAFARDGLWFRAELVEDEAYDEWLAARREELGVEKPGGLHGLGVSEALAPKPEAEQESQDLRILPILFDAAEERWRTLAEALPLYEEVDSDDFPLQGPRTVYRDVRQLRRQGMSWVQHHESWLKKSGVRVTDRSVHEHSSICRVLDYMSSYDQLNIPSLACAEALNRRRALIEVAHQGRPEAPSYEGADEILGVRDRLCHRPSPHTTRGSPTSCKG